MTPAADIYSFGVCLLEMAVLGLTNGEGEKGAPGATAQLSHDALVKKLELLNDSPRQKDFVKASLNQDPAKRPSARQLLFHPVLFEVHSLKLLGAHAIVNGRKRYERFEGKDLEDEEKRSQYLQMTEVNESLLEEQIRRTAQGDHSHKERVVAEIRFSTAQEPTQIKSSHVPLLELDKFLEDVKNGIYPLTAFASSVQGGVGVSGAVRAVMKEGGQAPSRTPAQGQSPREALSGVESAQAREKEPSADQRAPEQPKTPGSDAPPDAKEGPKEPGPAASKEAKEAKEGEPKKAAEDRRVIWAAGEMAGGGESSEVKSRGVKVKLRLKLDDQMNRELTGEVSETDEADALVEELVSFGLIHRDDTSVVAHVLYQALDQGRQDCVWSAASAPLPSSAAQPPSSAVAQPASLATVPSAAQ